jgi:hypothetical protein
VIGLSNVVGIAGGYQFTLAVTGDGHVYAWGENSSGELGTNTSAVSSTNSPMLVAGISNAVLVSAQESYDDFPSLGHHSMAVTLDQGVYHYWAWGDNTYGEVGNGIVGDANNAIITNQPTPVAVQFCTRCQRCVQLGTGGGTNGVLTAQCNGTMYLYFNTDNFGAAGGSYNVTFNGSNVTVLGNGYAGVAVGPVTVGNTYTFSASGTCYWNAGDSNTVADANGNGPWNCNDFSVINKTNAVCPMWQCFSLVGKIQ